jgi:predicted RNA polymerase sigma factor
LLIQRGLASLAAVARLGGEDGTYALQAALAAVHARAIRFDATDWVLSAALYDRLLARIPSPVVALNRAVAHAMAFGPEMGLRLLDEIAGASQLAAYSPFHAATGDFLFRLGRMEEAGQAFERAAGLSGNDAERAFLRERVLACRPDASEARGTRP